MSNLTALREAVVGKKKVIAWQTEQPVEALLSVRNKDACVSLISLIIIIIFINIEENMFKDTVSIEAMLTKPIVNLMLKAHKLYS